MKEQSVMLTHAAAGTATRRLVLLGVVFSFMFFAYTLLTFFYMPPHIGTFMRHAGIFFANRVVFSLFFLAFCILYGVFFFTVRKQHEASARYQRILILFPVVFVVILFLSPPFFSSDLFGYITRSAIANIHHANPYTITPASLGYSDFVAWPDKESVYGPLFISIGLLFNKIAGSDIVANLVVFRLAAAAVFAACGYLMYKILQQSAPKFRFIGTALFLWNPYILIEAVHSAHNDMYMVLFILASVYFIVTKKYRWSIVALTCAFLIKYSAIVLLPVVVLLIFTQDRKKAWRDCAIGALVGAALIAIAYLPYGSFSSSIGNLGRAFVKDNYLTLPQAFIQVALEGFHKLIPLIPYNLTAVRAGYIVAFLVPYSLLLFMGKRGDGSSDIKRYFWMLLLLVLLLGGKFNIWYILWCAPLVLITRDRWYHGIILIITVYGFLYYGMLQVFLPSVLFCLSLVIFALMVQWETVSRIVLRRFNLQK
ncbi:MAG: hypothetical protein PHY34_00145 [Patescibacteria group bacterium]|nr:hypothetical protein [Patescibacteria group bacterium]MDD5715958.1 hypothetical protein [Patescibacteria group bacterium]